MSSSRFGGPLIAGVSSIAALVVAELALRLLAPVPDPYLELKIHRPVNQFIRSEFPRHLRLRTEAEPGLPGVSGVNHFSTNNLGFRGDSLAQPKPAGEYRVFLLGGSSAEGLYLDDAVSLNAMLQQALQGAARQGVTVKVYNAGRSGDRSDDHVSMFVHRVAHLQPDLIVVFAGINDLSGAIYRHDFLHFEVRTPDGRTTPDTLRGLRLLRTATTEFQLPRRLFYLMRRLRPPVDTSLMQEIPLRSNYRALVAQRRADSATSDVPRTEPETFRTNLSSIAGAARASGIAVILMTQQTTWASAVDSAVDDWQWMRYRDGRTYGQEQMHRALESLNDVTRELARRQQIPLYDLAAELPQSREYLYDDVHFTVRGARTAGERLAQAIVRAGLLQRPRTGPSRE